MARLRRTLLIGLGGTGITSILNAKKMFYENYGEIPPMIGFIGIDTDAPGLKNASVIANDGTKITLSTSEQLCISVQTPTLIYQNGKDRGLYDWMPESNTSGLSALSIGAGQMRSNGRFAITVNEQNVQSFISNKMTEVNNATIIENPNYQLLGTDTEVHVVFSLGGGTGSGTFLNTAYLLKRMFPKIKLSGYAVLSDVFRIMVSGAMSSRVKTNGKGAIMDLDYLAHLMPDSEPVDIKWFRTTDQVNSRAFDALYFVDNCNENNDMFSHVEPLSQMIALAIVTSVGELGVALDSVSDNVSKLIADGTMDIKNKKAWVAGFGCAEIVFDGERLAKIYSGKAMVQLVNKMLNGGCDDPANIANTWFDNNKIRENLGRDDVIDYFMKPTPDYMFSNVDDLTNPEPECQQYINSRGVPSQADLNTKLESLKTRIDESLARMLKEQADRECGVYLCSQILLSILHQIELCDGEMEQEIKKLTEDDLPRSESGLKTACNELKDCMDTFFKKGKKEYEQEVVNETIRVATVKREIERRRMARQFYGWLKARVQQSIQRVDIIIQNLQNVRNESNNNAQKYLQVKGGDFFQFDLTSDYAQKLECPITDIVFNDFVRMIQSEGGVAAIAGMTSAQTFEVLMRYVNTLPNRKRYTEMTVDDALDNLDDAQFNALMEKAIKKSLPLLPYSFQGYDADLIERPVECYYVGVADKKRSRLVRDNNFAKMVSGAKDVQFSEVGLNNRVIIYRQLGVLPAFTIKALDGYDVEYDRWEETKPHGSHWDNNLCKRMERERFSLKPKGVSPNLFENWVNAIIFDLITYDSNSQQYQIKSKGLGGRALNRWMVSMGSSRSEAFQFFEDNIDVLEREVMQAIREMDVPGPDNPIRSLSAKAIEACNDNTYLEKVSKCPISLENIHHYPDEMDLIEREMNFILDNNK